MLSFILILFPHIAKNTNQSKGQDTLKHRFICKLHLSTLELLNFLQKNILGGTFAKLQMIISLNPYVFIGVNSLCGWAVNNGVWYFSCVPSKMNDHFFCFSCIYSEKFSEHHLFKLPTVLLPQSGHLAALSVLGTLTGQCHLHPYKVGVCSGKNATLIVKYSGDIEVVR